MPFRQDEIIGSATIFYSFGVMVVLLVIAYYVLRYYAKNFALKKNAGDLTDKKLACIAELRLSPRTKVYLIRVDNGRDIVVVESMSGAVIQQIDEKSNVVISSSNHDGSLGS